MEDVEQYGDGGIRTYNNNNNNNIRNRNFATSSLCCQCIQKFLLVLRYLPFLIITTFFIWGLYVYLYYVIYNYYETVWLRIILIVLFVPLYILSFWSYLRCVLTSHRSVMPEYYLPDSLPITQMPIEELNQILENLIQERNLPIFTRHFNGHVRFCYKCLLLKPDRSHHCSTCGVCIPKMDHHCHWVSNCVAFDNYKFFLQFLTYTVLLTMYVVITSVDLFLKFWRDEMFPGKFQTFFLIIFCFIFSLSILFLLSYHIYLVSKNVTTLEAYQPPRFKQYEYNSVLFNLGHKRNFLSVFGDDELYWFLPIYSSIGDGHYYELPLIVDQYDKNGAMNSENLGSPIGGGGGGYQQHTHATSSNHLNV